MFADTLKNPLTLRIQVPGAVDTSQATEISEAIRHHFRYILSEHERDWGVFIRERRTALAFTAFNILLALIYVTYAYQHEEWMTSVTGQFIGGIIIIMNWATIWDTYEYFIFDGREKRHRKKLLKKIIDAEITVVPPLNDA